LDCLQRCKMHEKMECFFRISWGCVRIIVLCLDVAKLFWQLGNKNKSFVVYIYNKYKDTRENLEPIKNKFSNYYSIF
jgi:hypothetical protein